MPKKLTHFDDKGRSRMVDVSGKAETARVAIARGAVIMAQETFDLIMDKKVAKGDVLEVARLAGIMAAKKTPDIIPLCHPINLSSVEVNFFTHEQGRVEIEATARVTGRTGVEMEAMTAVAAAGLTIYDMCKAVDRGMVITEIRLIKKSGGKSGTFVRKGK